MTPNQAFAVVATLIVAAGVGLGNLAASQSGPEDSACEAAVARAEGVSPSDFSSQAEAIEEAKAACR